jgi:DNA-binding response OmpR family regulator
MTKKILIVEDEEAILALLSTIFDDRSKYTTLCASDGEEALRIAQVDNPDIILLDIQIPKINGREVCKSVKSDPAMSHTKVLMLSGMAQTTGWQKAREVGADGYVAKPFDLIALMETVEELLKTDKVERRETQAIRVLVIEDEPAIGEACQRILGHQGFEVDIARNVKVARDIIAEKRYDCCLIDIKTPEMDVKELFQWLKEKQPSLMGRVVLTTGRVMVQGTQILLG